MVKSTNSHRASQSEILNFLTASSIPTQVVSAAGIPPSVVQALQTGIPTSFAQEIFTNSEARSSLAKDIQSSNYPDWYTSLPSGVQSYISAQETASPAEATATSTSTDSDSTDSPSSSSSSSSAGAESSTSDSGAPAQTGAMAAGLAGAAGVLGLAFAL